MPNTASGSRTGKREQIARLLINKFRQKYNVDFDSDNRLDAKIVDTVNAAVKSDEPLGEKQLVMLSRKLNQVVEDYRKRQRNGGPLSSVGNASSHRAIHKYFDNEVGSKASSRILSTSGSHSCKNNLKQIASTLKKDEDDIPKIIAAMTVNKGTGMSDAEWNEIVRQKVTREREEEQSCRNKIIFQRTSMRKDLKSQMVNEKELDSARKTQDRSEWLQSIAFADRKAQEEDMRRTQFKQSFIKKENYDCMEQIAARYKARVESENREKLADFAQRLEMEEKAKLAAKEVEDERSRYRQRLQSLTQEDRRQRQEWLEKNRKPKAPSEASSNLVTKFYKRPQHASHELRTRNDKVQNYITEKWALATPKQKTIEKPGDNYQERKNQEAEALQQERLETRRKKEWDMARILDKQVESHVTTKQILKVEDNQIGERMAVDVEKHQKEQDQVKKERVDKNQKHKQELEKLINQRQKIAEYIASSGAYFDAKKKKEEEMAQRAAAAALPQEASEAKATTVTAE